MAIEGPIPYLIYSTPQFGESVKQYTLISFLGGQLGTIMKYVSVHGVFEPHNL